MKLLHIVLKSHRYYNASDIRQCIRRLVKRESYILSQLILKCILGIIQYLCQSEIRRHLREYLVDDRVQLHERSALQLLHDLGKYVSLSLRPSEIISKSSPDPRVSSRLDSVQKLQARLRHTGRQLPSNLHDLRRISADIRQLLLLDVYLYSSHRIDHVDQRVKIHRHIMLDIQIQIPVQKRDRILRPPVGIRRIRLVKRSVLLL